MQVWKCAKFTCVKCWYSNHKNMETIKIMRFAIIHFSEINYINPVFNLCQSFLNSVFSSNFPGNDEYIII
jgi:hypothetical protein